MPKTIIVKSKHPSTVSATATHATVPATAGEPDPDNPTNDTATTTSVPSSILIASTTPPNVTLPATPSGFIPVKQLDYAGSRPKKGQLTALPGALAELVANAAGYTSVFEPIGTPVATLTTNLSNAGGWTNLRVAIEQFLEYVRSYEAITWKTALSDLATLNVLFSLLTAQNLQKAQEFPELLKLLEVTKVIGKKGASTRAKNAKAKATATTPTSTAAPSATNPETTTPAPASAAPANGGAAH